MARIVKILNDEHRALRRILGDLEAAVDPVDRQMMLGAIAALSTRFELHRRKEDDFVFPALAGRGRIHPSVLEEAQAEHRQAQLWVGEIQADLWWAEESSVFPAETVKRIRALVLLLRDHLWREEHLVFPILEGSTTPEEDRALVRQIEETEALESVVY